MKPKRGISILHQLLLATLLLVGANSAHATFPGKNGRIAFVLGPDIYTMNPDGSDVRQLTNVGPDNSASWASWSADGKQIVFVEFPPPDFNGQLWIMNADGSGQHFLLAERGITEERPSFSPDGKTVIFSRGYEFFADTGRPLIVQLYRINVDGGELTQITAHTTPGVHDFGPKYSPDGQTLLFQIDQFRGILDANYLINAEGSGAVRQITPSAISGRRPDWSPDGKKVVFQTHCCNPQNETIAVISARGTGLRELTHNGNGYDTGPHDLNPSWSPEGDSIVFERWTPDFSSSSIMVIRAENGEVRQQMLLPPARVSASRFGRAKTSADDKRNRHHRSLPNEIEEGGSLPRWGPVPN